MHLIYGGFFTLVSIMMLVFFGFFAAILGSIENEPDAPPVAFFYAIMGFIFVIYLLLSVPGLVAGYAMLKKKSWARIAGIISSVLAALSFPFGTALAVYSFWFFFGDAGKAFDNSLNAADWRGSLNQAADFGINADRQPTNMREPQNSYQPPPQPPNWRD